MEMFLQAVGIPFAVGAISGVAGLLLFRGTVSAFKTFMTIAITGGLLLIGLCYFYDFIPEEMKQDVLNVYQHASTHVIEYVKSLV